jgi:hypothetical protein
VSDWECPECGRRFARKGQGHECAPAMSIEEYFSTGDPREREVFDAVMARLAPVGEVFVEPVSVGIFLKRDGARVAQLRPMTRWVALSFSVPRTIRHARIARKPIEHGSKVFHVVNLTGAADVDDQVGEWLAEAYLAAGARAG